MFEFDYRLTGKGWAEARVADDEAWVLVTASYLSDALRSLVEAITLILEGTTESRCSWEEEPGEYRWLFNRNGDRVLLRILAFADALSNDPDEAGRLLFQTEQDPLRIARSILASAQTVLDQHGLDGYLTQWVEDPFPTESLARLRAALRQSRRSEGR